MAQASSSKLSLPLMILAFLSVAGFVYWLSETAQPTTPPPAVEEEEPSLALSLEVFQSRVDEIVDQRVSLPAVPVAAQLGPQAFWFQFADGNIYLTQIAGELGVGGFEVRDGDEVAISGFVRAMDDATLDQWVATGVIPANGRDMAAFAATYIEADRLEIQAPQAP
jgi:hypothetical protein